MWYRGWKWCREWNRKCQWKRNGSRARNGSTTPYPRPSTLFFSPPPRSFFFAHLYLSALPFVPTQSGLGQRGLEWFPNTLKLRAGAQKNWTNCLRIVAHSASVLSVAFSPDGRRVVSSSYDRTIRFWEVATADNPHAAYIDHHTLRNDGWLADSNSQLLVWLPPDLRAVFPIPPSSLVIAPKGAIHAGYSDLLVGESWNECYQNLVP